MNDYKMFIVFIAKKTNQLNHRKNYCENLEFGT